MPNQKLTILPAQPLASSLSLSFISDPKLPAAGLQTALQTALLDPDTGLFGANVIGIGQVIYASQIEAACLRVTGVLAVHNLQFSIVGSGVSPSSGPLFNPGAGNFFALSAQTLTLLGGS